MASNDQVIKMIKYKNQDSHSKRGSHSLFCFFSLFLASLHLASTLNQESADEKHISLAAHYSLLLMPFMPAPCICTINLYARYRDLDLWGMHSAVRVKADAGMQEDAE